MIHPAMIMIYGWFMWMLEASQAHANRTKRFDPGKVFIMNEHGTIWVCGEPYNEVDKLIINNGKYETLRAALNCDPKYWKPKKI